MSKEASMLEIVKQTSDDAEVAREASQERRNEARLYILSELEAIAKRLKPLATEVGLHSEEVTQRLKVMWSNA